MKIKLTSIPNVRLPKELETQVNLIMEIMEQSVDVNFSRNENSDLKKLIKFQIKESLSDIKKRARLKR